MAIDLTKPTGYIKPQLLTNAPITSDGTLVNDTVALVNDPKALVGGQTTQISSMGLSVSNNSPVVDGSILSIGSDANDNSPTAYIRQRH